MKQILIVFFTISMAIASAGGSTEQQVDEHKGFTEVWDFKTSGPIYGGSVINNGVLYTGSDDGCLYALSAETGTQIWKYQTDGAIRSTPIIANNTVAFSSDDGNLYALNTSNGSMVWNYNLGPAVSNRQEWDFASPSPASDGNVIYMGDYYNDFYAIDVVDGSLLWKTDVEKGFLSMPAIHKDIVYAGCNNGYVYGFDKKTGEVAFSFYTSPGSTGAQVDTRPLIIEKLNLMVCGGRNPWVYGVDLDTAEVKWKINYRRSWVTSSPIYSDGLVYVGSSDHRRLFCINPLNGDVEWTAFVGGYAWAIPAASDTDIYQASFLHDRKADLYCIDKKTGEIRGTYREKAMTQEELERTQKGNDVGIIGCPVLYNNSIFISTASGSVICLQEIK